VARFEAAILTFNVAKFAQPLGISLLSPELDMKRQDILIEAVPKMRRIGALADSRITSPQHLQALQDAAQARGIILTVFGVGQPDEISSVFERAKSSGIEALNVLATPLFFVNQRTIIERAAALR
jgi:hypothetical protein